MRVYDVAVIGSGIGGALFAALNHSKHDLILFEKEPNLGGCASTFQRYKGYYNAGATTFMGYEEGHIIKEIFDKVGYTPDLVKTASGVRIVQERIEIDRVKDFDTFLNQLNKTYPNPNNETFWRRLKEIDEAFWRLQKFHYAKHSTTAYGKTLVSITELLKTFKIDLFTSADKFIKKTLGEISPEYQAFIDAQLLITLQSTSKELSLLPMALGLSYTFHDTFYVNGGMGTLIENLLKEVNVHTQEPIEWIEQKDGFYEITSNKETYRAKNVVLNTTVYDSSQFFKNQNIIDYYQKFDFSDQSAFILYLRIDSQEEFLHHYQIILKENLPNSISNAFFVSFSDTNDNKMSEGGYSVTISTHTKASIWSNLSKAAYKAKKKETEEVILNAFLNYFSNIKDKEIKRCFSATAKTFKHYINRENCGGEAIKFKNILNIPTCTTSFKGLYNIGDTVFAGQGWAGIALGVNVLDKEFNG
jgi:phytoene dehydrogenase-like protein